VPAPAAPVATARANEGVATERPASGRPKYWPLLPIFVVHAALLVVCYLLAIDFAPAPRLVASDRVALPGDEVVLRVRLERDLPPLVRSRNAGVEIRSRLVDGPSSSGQLTPPEGALSVTTTAADGTATFPWTAPPEAGLYRFRADLDEPGEPGAEKALVGSDFLVRVLTAEQSLVIVAVGSRLGVAQLDEESTGLLEQLAKEHAIVYVALGLGRDPEAARARIAEYGLPAGPVLEVPVAVPNDGLDGGLDSRFDGATVRRTLQAYLDRQIRPRWKNIAWAIATDASQLRAFRLSGLRSLLVSPTKVREVDDAAIFWAPTWKDAEAMVQRVPP